MLRATLFFFHADTLMFRRAIYAIFCYAAAACRCFCLHGVSRLRFFRRCFMLMLLMPRHGIINVLMLPFLSPFLFAMRCSLDADAVIWRPLTPLSPILMLMSYASIWRWYTRSILILRFSMLLLLEMLTFCRCARCCYATCRADMPCCRYMLLCCRADTGRHVRRYAR